MVFYLGASSFRNGLSTFPSSIQRRLKPSTRAIPGLSFNYYALNKRKTVQFQIGKFLARRSDVILWHDVINNSITAHESNEFNPLPVDELIKLLIRYKRNFLAIVYIQREGTPNIIQALKTTGILVVDVINKVISKRKRKNPSLVQKYRLVHQPWELEAHTFTVVRRYEGDLGRLTTKNNRKRLSKARRAALKRKEKASKNR